MSLENLYNQGKESFVPDISDNPECVWFYAAWKGVKTVCESLEIEIDSIHHQVHHALCTSNGDWYLFLKELPALWTNIHYSGFGLRDSKLLNPTERIFKDAV